MARRLLGALLTSVLLLGQVSLLAAPLLVKHSGCICNELVCVCHLKKSARKPAEEPAQPHCHGPATPDTLLKLRPCDDPEEKDVTSASLGVLPALIRMVAPWVSGNTLEPGSVQTPPALREISPPPPRPALT